MNEWTKNQPSNTITLSSCLIHKLISAQIHSPFCLPPPNLPTPIPDPRPLHLSSGWTDPSGALGSRPGQGAREVAGGPEDPHQCPLLGPAQGREAPSAVSLIGFGLHGNPRAGGLGQGEGRRPGPADQWEPPSSAAPKPEWQPWRLTIVPPSAAAPRSRRGPPAAGPLAFPAVPLAPWQPILRLPLASPGRFHMPTPI